MLLAVLGGVPSPATAAECPTGWGSLQEQHKPFKFRGSVANVRAGRHACFDRLVVDFDAGQRPWFVVSYQKSFRLDGSGTRVPLRGGAVLRIDVRTADWVEPGYRPSNRREIVDVSGFRTLRQVAWQSGFEGYAAVGVGLRARLPFRVWGYRDSRGRSHLVVDVAHEW